MKIELCKESGEALLNYWFTKRNYANDCRWTQREMIKKEPEKIDFWESQFKQWDEHYKYCAKKLSELRKEIIGVEY